MHLLCYIPSFHPWKYTQHLKALREAAQNHPTKAPQAAIVLSPAVPNTKAVQVKALLKKVIQHLLQKVPAVVRAVQAVQVSLQSQTA
ncbi:hypothetical protein SDC9_193755 [bioreactor metagenome]|uniref:Uncharacterized protein n=1 Tax=bioreactor metagenome TaxID=1076179 RepID=A0A645I5V9_9ZZZZ